MSIVQLAQENLNNALDTLRRSAENALYGLDSTASVDRAVAEYQAALRTLAQAQQIEGML